MSPTRFGAKLLPHQFGGNEAIMATGAPEHNNPLSTAAHTDAHRGRTVESAAAFFASSLTSGMSVLDCGCGPGTITLGLAELVAPGHVIGVDLSPERVTEAVEGHMAKARLLPDPEPRFGHIVHWLGGVSGRGKDPPGGLLLALPLEQDNHGRRD